MGLAGQRGGDSGRATARVAGRRRAAEAVEVVDDARGGVVAAARPARRARIGASKKASSWPGVRSAWKPASESPSTSRAGLPITAVPTTMPSASKATSVGCGWGR